MFFVKIGLIICYDVRFLNLYICLVQVGVEVIIVLVVFLWVIGVVYWYVLLCVWVIEIGCWIFVSG